MIRIHILRYLKSLWNDLKMAVANDLPVVVTNGREQITSSTNLRRIDLLIENIKRKQQLW